MSGHPVEAISLFPTLYDLAGLPVPEHCQGSNLLQRVTPHRPYAFARARATSCAPATGLSFDGGQEELYEMRGDPGQFHNLARRPEQAAILESCEKPGTNTCSSGPARSHGPVLVSGSIRRLRPAPCERRFRMEEMSPPAPIAGYPEAEDSHAAPRRDLCRRP
ncbi:MAG: hypothetical protein R3E96_12795 [Planctomycetota bacterium]